ncbi:uncharacterized protein [Euwallacea fornicatus]|uniref:uncharacterized protein n=1 Tax=Euwallacea fornicatus TaxID=995702 RepID=UPI00338D61FA
MGDKEIDWSYMPLEILYKIFNLLSYYDKLAFMSSCSRWRDAAETATIWRKLQVQVDTDLNEPSIIFLTQKYYKYIEHLEIGWSVSYSQSDKKGAPRHKETVKKVGRFLVLLFERLVQLKSLTITEWYDLYQLKKLSYLLIRFIKHQSQLESLKLVNANMNNMSFSNILIACLKSKRTLTSISLRYSTFNSKRLFDSTVFTNCIEMFYNLEILTLDCWIFMQFFSKLQARFKKLKVLNLHLDNSTKRIDTLNIMQEGQKDKFFACLPKARVHLIVEKPMTDNQFMQILQNYYPLVSFEWTYSPYMETCYMDCCQCLERLVSLQQDTLEAIKLVLPLAEEKLKDKISHIKQKCYNLESFQFNNVELMEAVKIRTLLIR